MHREKKNLPRVGGKRHQGGVSQLCFKDKKAPTENLLFGKVRKRAVSNQGGGEGSVIGKGRSSKSYF